LTFSLQKSNAKERIAAMDGACLIRAG